MARGNTVQHQIIREALYPYPDGLHIVTKVGSVRDAEGNWRRALAPEQLRQAVYDNMNNLDALADLDRIAWTTTAGATLVVIPLHRRSRPMIAYLTGCALGQAG